MNPTPNDEQIMWRVQAHDDPDAFTELVRRWRAPILRLCQRLLTDSHRAEDITQETFTRVFVHRRRYQPKSKFSTYLWRIALNLCHDEQRKLSRRLKHESTGSNPPAAFEVEQEPDDLPSPDRAAVLRESALAVRNAVHTLPEPLRTVLVLRHYEGLKLREIAEVLGIPEGTAKSRMAEALNTLRRCLEDQTTVRVQHRSALAQNNATKPQSSYDEPPVTRNLDVVPLPGGLA
jgi:RNA polymerase sigma-70 factor (ECF subfamily)